MRVLITGGGGLVGTKFINAYKDVHELVQPATANGSRVDITDEKQLQQAFDEAGALDGVLHLAAYTDVNGAFAQTDDKNGSAWKVNVLGTKIIAHECARRGIYLIHVSTAFVFDGEKNEPYVENDLPHPIEWYGLTKHEAEKEVMSSGAKSVILRIDQPFSPEPSAKVDTLWRVIKGLQEGTLYPQFTTHYFGPTVIEELAKVFDFCLRARPTGIYHASSGERWSDFEFATMVKETLGLPGEVREGDLEKYLASTKRPYQRNTAMDTSKLKEILDFPLTSVREAVARVNL